MYKSADISSCGKYRYSLSRMWGSSNQGIVYGYFGINPSTADASIDDATVKKWIGFTKRNNGRGFLVGNAFAYRATNVKDLSKTDNPVGENNILYIQKIINTVDVIVPCWGNSSKVSKNLRPQLEIILDQILKSGKPVKIFGKTKSGDPLHPQMLAYSTSLIDYTR